MAIAKTQEKEIRKFIADYASALKLNAFDFFNEAKDAGEDAIPFALYNKPHEIAFAVLMAVCKSFLQQPSICSLHRLSDEIKVYVHRRACEEALEWEESDES